MWTWKDPLYEQTINLLKKELNSWKSGKKDIEIPIKETLEVVDNIVAQSSTENTTVSFECSVVETQSESSTVQIVTVDSSVSSVCTTNQS